MKSPALICFIAMTALTALSANSAQDGSHWEQFFPNGLINSEGQEVSPTVLKGKFVCLYFSASWCVPCPAFTPKLIALRDQAKEHIEVVFVSHDRSAADQLKYMKDNGMEWPAVKWADHRLGDVNEPGMLIRKYQGWGTPTVFVLSPSGEVVDTNARMKIQFLPEENLKRLQDLNIDDAMDYIRKNNQEKEKQLSKENMAGGSPTWEQLLADFYRAQRLVTQR